MNVRRVGSNLASTSIFEENMSDLTTTSLNTTSAATQQLFKGVNKSISKTSSYVKSSASVSSSSIDTTSIVASSTSRFLSGSLITSSSAPTSLSSSSSLPLSSLASENSSSSPSFSYPHLTYPVEDATLEHHPSSRLTLSSIPEVPSGTLSTQTSVPFGVNGADTINTTRNDSLVKRVNRVKVSGFESDDTSFSTISSPVIRLEGVEAAGSKNKERPPSLNRNCEEEDEGFASGDESGDDSEPEDDNPGLHSSSSTSRNIEGADEDRVAGGTSDRSPDDDRVFDSTADGELLFRFVDTMEEIEFLKLNSTWYNENSSMYNWNSSMYNDTYVVVAEGMYPSGYSLLQIILASIAATVLMIVVVVGNMLVIIAIATEKALKNIQNWFIASLAVADFFLGLVIMPFSLANEIMGYWIFGYLWCDIYSAMDVLLCTASIMNLCLISLDRFWSITQAIDYLKKRTPARAALMITLVWLLSALVCIPPLLGWKRPQPAEEYPKCSLSEDIGYVLYSALGSFYIPSCIMVFVYIRIYFAAKARARRGIRKQPRPRPAVPPESPDVRQTSFTQSTPATDTRKTPGMMENVATIESQPVQIPIVTCDFASDVSTSEADPGGGCYASDEKDTLKVSMPIPMQKTSLKASLSPNGSGDGGSSGVPARCRAPSVGIDVDMVSEFDPSSSDSGVVSRCAVVKPLKLRLCRPIFGRKAIGKLKREHADPGKHSAKETQEDIKPAKPRDPEREKRRLARKKEKRATLILGLIMGSFIACWLPFFFLYIVKPLFPTLEIPVQAFAIAFWLGYMNSALNPVIYTVFNKDFRRAFRRILYK
ncbi:alpha-2B adrenergic receptor [Venturia canescens]|uniref:alpha-2B adrenergic receptor n=1 Tax=Venturia canescens TaxID=32260 RepID=UPI001C9C805F|nr:alpha-2B adrenergic receptor [Venturia canescens]